jgi:flagellar assembly protein FliH
VPRSIVRSPREVRLWHEAQPPLPTAWAPDGPGRHRPEAGAREAGGGSAGPLWVQRGEGTVPPAAAGAAAGLETSQDAEALLQSARERADQILREAHEEAETLRARAHQEGFADGSAAGREEGLAEREQLRTLAARMQESYQAFCTDQLPALAALVAEAAGHLLQEQLALEPERVLAIVEQALARSVASSRVRMHLHPADVEIVRPHLAARQDRETPEVQIVADSTLERGGCWLETEQGEVDATVSGRVARLARALEEV